jgi:U3 small nucleolar ribonucleoprotein protein IMP4
MSGLRRNIRLRKEYLYRKSLEGKERDDYERRLKVKKALAGEWLCPPLFTLLRGHATGLQRESPSRLS